MYSNNPDDHLNVIRKEMSSVNISFLLKVKGFPPQDDVVAGFFRRWFIDRR